MPVVPRRQVPPRPRDGDQHRSVHADDFRSFLLESDVALTTTEAGIVLHRIATAASDTETRAEGADADKEIAPIAIAPAKPVGMKNCTEARSDEHDEPEDERDECPRRLTYGQVRPNSLTGVVKRTSGATKGGAQGGRGAIAQTFSLSNRGQQLYEI